MAVEAKFTAPLQVVETRDTRDRIVAIAEREKISQAQVIREIIDHGLKWREERSQDYAGLS